MRAARGRNSLFALCIDNADYPTSLEARKLYEVLPNDETVPHGQVRVIDESGEDYLYPARYFRLSHSPALRRAPSSSPTNPPRRRDKKSAAVIVAQPGRRSSLVDLPNNFITISPNYAPGPEPTRSKSVRVPCEDQELRKVPTCGAIYCLLIKQAGSEIIVDPHWDIQVERVWAV